MNIVGFTNLVVLAILIVVVYPLLKIQLSRVIGKGTVSTLLAVVISIALLKLATNLVEKTFVSYGVDFEAKEMKHRERNHREGINDGTTAGGSSTDQVVSMKEIDEMIGEGFGMLRREGFAYGGSKEGLFHMSGKKNKKSKCDCGCDCPNCRS